MNNYFVLFRLPVESVDAWMGSVSPEERQKQSAGVMDAWKGWSEKYKANIVESGSPLGKTKRITKEGIADTRNDLNYFMVIQAASHDEAAKIVEENPHTQMIPTSFVDVMEIPHAGM